MIDNNPEEVAEKLSPIFDLDKEYILTAFKEMKPTNVYSGYDKLAQLLYDINLIEKEPTAFKDLPNYKDLV